MSARCYYAGGGRHFCYNVAPTFICSYSQLKIPEPPTYPPQLVRAAQILGMMPDGLARMLVRGHRNNNRLRIEGRLTDRCEACGHKMERLGFRCWEEREKPPSDLGAAVQRMGFGPPTDIVKTVYVDTKKEAHEWAYEEYRLAKAIAKESDQ